MTAAPSRRPLFARPEFQAVAGETLRPGGLALTRRALDVLELPPGALVLDLGCGRGATAKLLAARGGGVLALDPSPALLAWAGGRGVSRILGRAQAVPLANASVDAVFCECVLSVTGEPDAVLAEVARVLKPGGRLVLSDLYLRPGACGGASRPGAAPADCLFGARPEAALRQGLAHAGLKPELFEDHSRLLAQLAGELIFAGLPARELCGCEADGKPGYFLCLARKSPDVIQ
ncbi:MAG: hypothetical protein AUJ49_08860 [Desulfovibrionaceae bacterium CG1_02_65_16]|nr:MAG: hypothetical protein AUJ49_08860 [Desulfovibrionaceae bacterium CG1_02_65_16]